MLGYSIRLGKYHRSNGEEGRGYWVLSLRDYDPRKNGGGFNNSIVKKRPIPFVSLCAHFRFDSNISSGQTWMTICLNAFRMNGKREREGERKFRRSVVADDARRSVNRGRAKLVTNRIVRSKWRSPYPFYRPSSDGTRFTATRGNMYPTHHPLCGTIIQICDRQTTNIITPSPSPMFSFPFTLFQRSSRESSRHDSTTILSRDEEKFFDSSPIVGRFFDETKKFLDISVSIYYIS